MDIVSDVNGSHINFTDTLTASPYFESSNIANGIHFNSDTSVDINASAFTNPELLDSVVTNSRRLRFYNPWSAGGVDSSGPDDQFTLSANATFAGAAASQWLSITPAVASVNNRINDATVSGQGYDRNSSAGVPYSLVITGNNFFGINRIQFMDDSLSSAFAPGLDITGLTPGAPFPSSFPVGSGQITFSSDARTITITGGVFDANASWADSNASTGRRVIRLHSVTGKSWTSGPFDTNSSIEP